MLFLQGRSDHCLREDKWILRCGGSRMPVARGSCAKPQSAVLPLHGDEHSVPGHELHSQAARLSFSRGLLLAVWPWASNLPSLCLSFLSIQWES